MRFAAAIVVALSILHGADVAAVELKTLAIEFRKFPGKTYFSELPDEEIREEIAVVFETHLGGCFYWWNEVHGSSTDAQFRWIGWHHQFECRDPIPRLDLFYEHHSQHSLDRTQPEGHHFPVQDALGLRWKLFP
jgi:hypothetical protein